MKFKLDTLVAAAALALSAGGAQAAIGNSNENFGNSSALFVAMDGATGTPSNSLVVDLGVSMADFVEITTGVSNTAGALSAFGTSASWNFNTNSRTVNGAAVTGDYAWSDAVSSFFSSAQGGVRWGVIGADNVSGAISGTNTLTNRNMLATGSPTQANINNLTSAAAVSSGIGVFQNFVAAQAGTGTHGTNANGASTASTGNAFLNTALRGNFNGQLPWNYLSAVDTTSNLFLVNQLSNPVVYQLGKMDSKDTLLTADMATFHYDSANNVLSFAAPVPEPETYAMLLAGLAIVGSIVRRRNRRA
jgi:PEP-CTERM motif